MNDPSKYADDVALVAHLTDNKLNNLTFLNTLGQRVFNVSKDILTVVYCLEFHSLNP